MTGSVKKLVYKGNVNGYRPILRKFFLHQELPKKTGDKFAVVWQVPTVLMIVAFSNMLLPNQQRRIWKK